MTYDVVMYTIIETPTFQKMPVNSAEEHVVRGSQQTQRLVISFRAVAGVEKYVGQERAQGKEAVYELFTLPA